MTAVPGERAIASLEIDDIFIIESNCEVSREWNQSAPFNEVPSKFRLTIEPDVLGQIRKIEGDANNPEIHILRYIVAGELYILKQVTDPASEEANEPAPEDTLASLKLKFAVDYRCQKETYSDPEAIQAFRANVGFHVWPYWREAIHDVSARMRLPRVTIPMMKVNDGKLQTKPVEQK